MKQIGSVSAANNVLPLLVVTFMVMAVAGEVAAGSATSNYSPLFSYRHQKAVVSMNEDAVTPPMSGGTDDPMVPPSVLPWFSGCLGSICLGSWCGGSACFGTWCGISGCWGSHCIGSGCIDSYCVFSACAVMTQCVRSCQPTAPFDPQPATWHDCTFGACGLNP